MTSKEFHPTKKHGFWKHWRQNTKGQSNKTCPKKNHTSVQNQSVMGDLKDSGDGYVLTPVDKANGNVSLIWKKYAPTFFEHCKNIDHGNLLKNTFNDLFIYFGTSASEDNKCLPSACWFSKLHKNWTKGIFVIVAPTCSVKTNFQSSNLFQ